MFSLATGARRPVYICRVTRRVPIPILALALLGCSAASAPDRGAGGGIGELEVRRAVAWGLPAAASLTVGMHLAHSGAVPDTLESAQTDDGALMLHDVVDGRMVMLDLLELSPGDLTVLGTGRAHLMLEGVSPDVWDAEVVQVTLRFRRAGSLTLRVPIVNYSEAMRELRR